MFYLVFLIWLLLDLFTKHLIQTHFVLGESVPVIPNVFHLTYILNYGAAFGILNDQRIFFLLIAVVMVGVFLKFKHKISEGSTSLKIAAGMLMAGTLGNAYNRFAYGAVVDFFDFRIWPIFNIADIGICIGVTIIAYYIWKADCE